MITLKTHYGRHIVKRDGVIVKVCDTIGEALRVAKEAREGKI